MHQEYSNEKGYKYV